MYPATLLLSSSVASAYGGLLLIFLPVEEKLIITLVRSVRYSSKYFALSGLEDISFIVSRVKTRGYSY